MALLALVLAFACPHDPSLGTVTFPRGGVEHSVSLRDCRDRVVGRISASRPVPLSAPGGGRLFVRGQALWLVARDGRRRRLTPRQPGQTVPLPILFSPDGRYVLWAAWYDHANSANADGVPLEATGLAPGSSTRLVVRSTLAYPDYLTWCGSRLVLVGGADREAGRNKRLLVAAPPLWMPRLLWSDPARAFGSVACAPDRRSVAVLSQPASDDAGFFDTRWQLWRVGLDGSRTLLDAPPAGSADESPRWSRDGRALLFVRERQGHGRLMLWRAGRVTGPIADLGYSLGYYGHHDWRVAFAP